MKYNQIHHVLDNIIPELNETLECINSGGCGHIALAMHRALNAINVSSEIVLVNASYNKYDVDRLLKYTGKDNLNDAYHHLFDHELDTWGYIPRDTLNGHVCVVFDGKVYDGNGRTTLKAISEHITIPTMQRFLNIASCWNDAFRSANRGIDYREFLQRFFTNTFAKHLS